MVFQDRFHQARGQARTLLHSLRKFPVLLRNHFGMRMPGLDVEILVSLQKPSIEDSLVSYLTDDGAGRKLDPLEFTARLQSHIPDKWESTVRYFGIYSHRYRGEEIKNRAAEPTDDTAIPIVDGACTRSIKNAGRSFPDGYVLMLSRTSPALSTQDAVREAGIVAYGLTEIFFSLILYIDPPADMRGVLTTDEHEYSGHDFGRLLNRGIDITGVIGEQAEAVRAAVHTGDVLSAVFADGAAPIFHSPAPEPHPLTSKFLLPGGWGLFEVSVERG